MPVSHGEIIADIQEHIHRVGGSLGEWCVGIAKNTHGSFFKAHRVEDLGYSFIYREAYTPTGAQAAGDYLVKECGLHLDLEDVPDPGRIVFVHHKQGIGNRLQGTDGGKQATGQNRPQTSPLPDHPAFPKRAA